MILTVTPNPALDLTWTIERIEIGGTHRAEPGFVRAGGKGLNVARVLHSQRYPVIAITTSGGDTGAEFNRELEASGVPHRLIAVTAATRRSVAWVDRSLGDTTIVNERGVSATTAEWDALTDATMAELARASVLVISGSVAPGTPVGLLPALIAAGKAADVDVIVDTSGPGLLRAAEAGATVLKPNRLELAEATGIDDPVEGARELRRRGAGLVLVSLGAAGMIAVGDGDALRARIPASLAGNPTGAGDAAVAACAAAFSTGVRETTSILRASTAWSAAAVLMPHAGEISSEHPQIADSVIIDRVVEQKKESR